MISHSKTSHRILVISPSWIGDTLLSQSLFKLLKQNDPFCSIDVLAPTWVQPVFERMPEIENILSLPFKHGEFNLYQRYQIGKSLRNSNYQQAIVLPNSWKSALIPWFAKIPIRTGWRGEFRYGLLNDLRILDEKKYPLMVQRYAALALSDASTDLVDYPNPQLTTDPIQIEKTLKKYHLAPLKKSVLILCPGAEYGPSKCWPLSYYAIVARQAAKEGYDVWLLGSPKDLEIGRAIQMQTSQTCINLIGKTSLSEAIDLLSCADAVITNDSGLMHVAAALNRPLIALYGSTSPNFTPPLFEQAKILKLNLPCQPCMKRICPLGHHRCMIDLKPERVLKNLGVETSIL